jgi:hypothetical protein
MATASVPVATTAAIEPAVAITIRRFIKVPLPR